MCILVVVELHQGSAHLERFQAMSLTTFHLGQYLIFLVRVCLNSAKMVELVFLAHFRINKNPVSKTSKKIVCRDRAQPLVS